MEVSYDASLEFSDGTIFYYKDGKASAWKERRKDLIIEGRRYMKLKLMELQLNWLQSQDKENLVGI
jgi:hypothetical protein